LNASIDYVQQAKKLSVDPKVLSRVNELELYLNYVNVYLQSQDLENGDLEQRVLPVAKMAWMLYEKKIIHSYRIMQLASYTFLNAQTTDKALAERYQKLHRLTFPESSDPNVFWKKDFDPSVSKIRPMVTDRQAKKDTPLSSNTSTTVDEEIQAAKSKYEPKQTITLQSNYLHRAYFNLFSEKPSNVTINWWLTNSKGEPPSATLSGADKSYKAVYDFPLQSSQGELSLSLPAGEVNFFVNGGPNTTYKLQLHLNQVFCFFGGSPRGQIGFFNDQNKDTYDPSFYPSYFYIPRNTTTVQYSVQVNALKILNPEGEAIKTNLISTSAGGFELRSFEVPANFRGKFWTAVISGNYNYKFLNIPDRYYLLKPK